MTKFRRYAIAGATCLLLASLSTLGAQQNDKDAKSEPRPKLTLRAQPMVSMAPSRVVLTAEIVGGPNDYEEFYCPTVEWQWGDGTTSEASADCEPYQAGKSEIKRRFTVEHVFRAGNYRVFFRLKHAERQVGAATTSIQVRPGLRDIGAQ